VAVDLDGVLDDPNGAGVEVDLGAAQAGQLAEAQPAVAATRTSARYRGSIASASRAISMGARDRISSRSMRGSSMRRHGVWASSPASTAPRITLLSVW
jgi:hypothetical protein